jgi:hypothetical protein
MVVKDVSSIHIRQSGLEEINRVVRIAGNKRGLAEDTPLNIVFSGDSHGNLTVEVSHDDMPLCAVHLPQEFWVDTQSQLLSA